MMTAIVVDDNGSDRKIAARVFQKRGWQVFTARHSVEAQSVLASTLARVPAETVVIITDLNMPSDPAHRLIQPSSAGANLALQLRTQMEQGRLPRMPIIGLTSLTEREVHLTAIAFGCDAVLEKPATPDLCERIEAALARAQADESDPIGATAMLRLLRQRLIETAHLDFVQFTEHDLTKALLQYRRQGVVGLGQSKLALSLFPLIESPIKRGEQTHDTLMLHLNAIMQMDVIESLEVLHGELIDDLSPADQADRLAISLSEYYRRRREAIHVLFGVMTGEEAAA